MIQKTRTVAPVPFPFLYWHNIPGYCSKHRTKSVLKTVKPTEKGSFLRYYFWVQYIWNNGLNFVRIKNKEEKIMQKNEHRYSHTVYGGNRLQNKGTIGFTVLRCIVQASKWLISQQEYSNKKSCSVWSFNKCQNVAFRPTLSGQKNGATSTCSTRTWKTFSATLLHQRCVFTKVSWHMISVEHTVSSKNSIIFRSGR